MRFFDRFTDWETTAEFIGVICGLGILGYIGATWILSLWGRGSYAIAIAASFAGILLTLSALARIPVALVLVFGSAAVSIVAFFSGYLSMFLP